MFILYHKHPRYTGEKIMVFLIIFILLYSIIYLTVFILAHQDANMIKPLTTMTVGMILLLVITAFVCVYYDAWYFGIVIGVVVIGMLRFLLFLLKR